MCGDKSATPARTMWRPCRQDFRGDLHSPAKAARLPRETIAPIIAATIVDEFAVPREAAQMPMDLGDVPPDGASGFQVRGAL